LDEGGEAVTGVKLNWFSPVPPTRSAIAINTAAVLPALARCSSLTLWAHEGSWSPELEEHARVLHYNPANMPWAEINAADVTIFHLGNHPEFHAPIWQVNRQHPGIVVLHDLDLQQLFAGLVTRNLGLSQSEYREMMEFYHPGSGPELAEAFLSDARRAGEIWQDCPLTGAALENAIGVVVHTQLGCSLLAAATTLPVAYVPPFASSDGAEALHARGRGNPRPNEQAYRIIMFGFLGPNRRLDSVLNALRSFPQRHRFRVDIYGTLENENSIRQMIQDFELTDLVTIHGFVPATELTTALSRSDLAVNLRDPTMGEASASQLRIWQHGLPSLVTDIGWYATLPNDIIARVRRDAELEDIQTHFANFLRAPESYRQLGRNGRHYVKEHHTVDGYVRALLDLVEVTLRSQPRQAVDWMSGRAGRAIRAWFADDAAGVLLPNLAGAISGLFDQRNARDGRGRNR
jgi:glycosyltransferase involved in cell wall biosynthesis